MTTPRGIREERNREAEEGISEAVIEAKAGSIVKLISKSLILGKFEVGC